MSFLPNVVSNTKADVDVNSGLDSNSQSISPFLNDLMSQDLIVDDMSAKIDEIKNSNLDWKNGVVGDTVGSTVSKNGNVERGISYTYLLDKI